MTDIREHKAGDGSVDPDDFNALVDAVKALQESGGGLPPGGTTDQVLAKDSDADGDASWHDGGGSQPWVELFNSEDLTDSSPAWTGRTEDGGDWEIGAAGVISQTDDTGDDDTDKKLTLDLSEFFTADALAGVTGLAIACEYRADSAPGDNFGQITCQGANVTLGIITQATDWVVYEQTDDDPFVVPVGDWSAQSLALTAVATAVLAGGVVCDDGGGTGGVPRVVGLNYSPGIECMAYVGGFQFGGADIAFKTTNGAGSFRRLRIFAIYGQPAIPAP